MAKCKHLEKFYLLSIHYIRCTFSFVIIRKTVKTRVEKLSRVSVGLLIATKHKSNSKCTLVVVLWG